ncbi:hypothetical protein ACT1U9_19470 [Streptomyces sp. BR1]|uniref:hypothetical protein n=1 Tax=Streptomyces sp. BR1 TaxID=1592323 RepID=UPI00402B5B2F
MHCIAQFLELLWRFSRPSVGRHRAAVRAPVAEYPDTPTSPLPRVRVGLRVPVLRGEDSALVRPYLAAYERQEKEGEQTSRRRVLLLALHGIDVGPCVIHGVAVGR